MGKQERERERLVCEPECTGNHGQAGKRINYFVAFMHILKSERIALLAA